MMLSCKLHLLILSFLLIINKGLVNAVCFTSSSITTRPGSNQFLDCTCTNVDAVMYTIQWCLERSCSSPLTIGGNYNIDNQVINSTTVLNTLTVITAQVDDTATYYCEGNGGIVAETNLTVVDVPEARIMPRDASIRNGENTILTCRLTDSSNTILNEPVVWKKNGEDVKEDLDEDEQTDIFINGTQLTIVNADSSDGGSYSCGQYNRALEVEDTLVIETPVQTSEAKNVITKVTVGKTVNLECTAKGYPMANFEWIVKTNENTVIKKSSSIKNNTLLSTTTSTLSWKASKGDTALYICSASNGVGETAVTPFGVFDCSSGQSLKPSIFATSVLLLLYIATRCISSI